MIINISNQDRYVDRQPARRALVMSRRTWLVYKLNYTKKRQALFEERIDLVIGFSQTCFRVHVAQEDGIHRLVHDVANLRRIIR